ncbi:MAG: peroxidase [Xanthomonadales bacterium]|nr:peroxidase [Gammaproteobacteria bacterium]NND56520.1 peroxidase [Xanthomonadales bacterium]
MSQLSGIHAFCGIDAGAQRSNRFGRLFELPPLYTKPEGLSALGSKSGPMDGGTTSSRTNTVDVGQVFFGQFIDHDITLDTTSSLASVADPAQVANVRTPTLDLDCIYGLGPEASGFMYRDVGGNDPFNGVKLLTGADGTAVSQPAALAKQDLSRSAHGRAVIGDHRNDENRIISQLQLAMIRFHNKIADVLNTADPHLVRGELFEEARRQATWHYQWVVLHDFLPMMCGKAVVDDILGKGRRFYCAEGGEPFIPVEFSVAAYRFGHSMIPQKIQVQKGKPSLKLFGPELGGGFKPLANAKAVVDWNELVTTSSGANVQKAEKLDSKMARTLLALPFIPVSDINSLASRNLLRGQAFRLPSGESVAEFMGRPTSEIDTVRLAAENIAGSAADLSSGTPLWFYLLVEAEKVGRQDGPNDFEPGEGLGPVGARIVAETIIGLMELDERSFMASNRNWSPAEASLGVGTLGAMLTL